MSETPLIVEHADAAYEAIGAICHDAPAAGMVPYRCSSPVRHRRLPRRHPGRETTRHPAELFYSDLQL